MGQDLLDAFVDVVASRDAVLFTGAGFSAGALDLDGRGLPRSVDMADELWARLFEGDAFDGSTLPDLVDVALARGLDLSRYLHARLSVDHAAIPTYYEPWFRAPWRRIYTLNVDDLEDAAARRFELPRPMRTIARPDDLSWHRLDTLDVVHLNGSITAPETMTFATSQYASRLAGTDPLYARLCDDLARHPFVFVGTVLDEPVFWKYLAVCAADRPSTLQSFLLTRSLTRGRQLMLEQLGVRWIAATVEDAAPRLARLDQQ